MKSRKDVQQMTYEELFAFVSLGVQAQYTKEVFEGINEIAGVFERFSLRQEAELSFVWGGVIRAYMAYQANVPQLQPA